MSAPVRAADEHLSRLEELNLPLYADHARLLRTACAEAEHADEAAAWTRAGCEAMRARGMQNPIAFARLYAPSYDGAAHAETQ